MNLCSDGHNEVCFEGRNCPVCEAQAEAAGKIEALKREIATLENKLEYFQEIRDARADYND